ncbi:MAG: glycosyltransferase family 2 protein [Prevotella sp.]|nr:glycosyltransferase family 2 protein [Prevotella sp.]
MKQSDQTPRPMISFIITAYNLPAALLRECIGSVLAVDLTREEREIILVDDGSDIPPLSQLLDFQEDIICIRQTNKGPSAARNTGLELAKGAFVQFVDGDDCLIKSGYNTVLARLRQTADDGKTDMLMFRHARQTAVNQCPCCKKAFRRTAGRVFLAKKNVRSAVWGYVFRREILGDLRFITDIYHGEDEAFTPYLILRARDVLYSSVAAYYYRRRPDSITSNPSEAQLAKRITDLIATIEGMKREAQTGEGRPLERRACQLAMDCVFQAMSAAANYEQALNYIKPLFELRLFPLPLRLYTTKYFLFALATHCGLLRRAMYKFIKSKR